MRCLIRCCLLLLLSGLLPRLALAQDTAPSEFRFEHLTVDQGLSHSDAMAVAQDRAGFIWVGTNRGLDRYDGYNLKPYTLPITRQGVAGNRIKVLHVAPATGRLWVGTERAGLNFYDATADQLLPLREQAVPVAARPLLRQMAGASVMALVSDVRGQLWVGTQHDGLFVLAFDERGQVISLHRVPTATKPIDELLISSLATDAEGNVWVGSFNRGLGLVRPSNASPMVEATALTELVRVLHVDRRGDLWIALDQRVLWVSAANRRAVRELTAHPQPLAYPQLQSLQLDSFGRLWVGTIYGLYVWEAGAVTGQAAPLRAAPTLLLPADGDAFSLNSERVHQIFEDRTQVMWLEQFQTEKEKELTNLKLGFFTNISRELRTPLTLILGLTEEISNSPGPRCPTCAARCSSCSVRPKSCWNWSTNCSIFGRWKPATCRCAPATATCCPSWPSSTPAFS